MIVLEVDSGLGNQMFMYAAAKALAVKHETDLYLDVDAECVSGYGKGQTFQLNKFNISAKYADKKIISQFDSNNKFGAYYNYFRSQLRNIELVRKISKSLRHHGVNPSIVLPVGSINQERLYEEKDEDWAYKSDFLSTKDNTYIKGYFPSYKYFSDIEEVILKEFSLKEELSKKGKHVLEEIKKSNSISIHFRRGDVVSDSKYSSWYRDVVTDDYYRNAIKFFTDRIDDPHFYIFSNEIDWVKENFHIPGDVTYVDHNPPECGYEDLFLMSQCKNNVTTGCSSFSWWAAYLNPNKDKIVIRTRKMNFHEHLNIPEDFFPEEWVIVES